jgi:single-stranded DNA-binding protein
MSYSNSINNVKIVGSAGPPVATKTEAGRAMTKLVITTRTVRPHSGMEYEDRHRVVCFDALARIAADVRDGQQVMVEGRLTYWPSSSHRAEVIASNVEPMEATGKSSRGSCARARAGRMVGPDRG